MTDNVINLSERRTAATGFGTTVETILQECWRRAGKEGSPEWLGFPDWASIAELCWALEGHELLWLHDAPLQAMRELLLPVMEFLRFLNITGTRTDIGAAS